MLFLLAVTKVTTSGDDDLLWLFCQARVPRLFWCAVDWTNEGMTQPVAATSAVFLLRPKEKLNERPMFYPVRDSIPLICSWFSHNFIFTMKKHIRITVECCCCRRRVRCLPYHLCLSISVRSSSLHFSHSFIAFYSSVSSSLYFSHHHHHHHHRHRRRRRHSVCSLISVRSQYFVALIVMPVLVSFVVSRLETGSRSRCYGPGLPS